MFFSIVIPTYSRPKRLERCLESVNGLAYPRDRFEVIVVDDGSDEPLDAIVEPFQDGLDLTLLRQSNSGPAAARNTGAAKAKGQYIAFTDDDCQLSPDWLEILSLRLAASPAHLVGGRTINVLKDNPYSTASQILIDYLFSYYNFRSGYPSFFTSNNLTAPADRFRQIGGFDTHFPRPGGEDRHFCDYWIHMGYESAYAPEAVIFHAHELTLPSFWRQHYTYGRGAFDFHKKRAERGNGRVKMEPLSFYSKMLVYPFTLEKEQNAWCTSALLGISQVANAAGYYRERLTRPKDTN